MNSKDTIVELRGVSKRYGDFHALRKISIAVARGECLVLCGPSGSGKSTVLRCINGLEAVSGGEIFIRGKDVTRQAAEKRALIGKIGMVFQSFNLFPHLTALQNATIGPIKALGADRAAAVARGRHWLSQVGLADRVDAFPHELSGGQQQRVAIARTLCLEPDIVLFDEPTSSLDPEMVKEVLDVMRELVRGGMTMMIVSHELSFAREVASRIVFMDGGIIVEEGLPEAFFSMPREDRTRRFLQQALRH